jgi:hypothetical protein
MQIFHLLSFFALQPPIPHQALTLPFSFRYNHARTDIQDSSLRGEGGRNETSVDTYVGVISIGQRDQRPGIGGRPGFIQKE